DSVWPGDPTADVLALSATMILALTHRRTIDRPSIDLLPHPFQEIARNCLLAEPQHRWSSADVANSLRSGGNPSTIGSMKDAPLSMSADRKKWVGFFAVSAMILLAIGVGAIVMRRTENPGTANAQPPAATEPEPIPAPTVRPPDAAHNTPARD